MERIITELPIDGRPAPARRRRKADRPGELLAAALECFLDRGFEATRVDDVAASAGVAKGTVYRYFETKEQLLRAVIQRVTGDGLAGVARIVDGDEAGSDDAVARALGEFVRLLRDTRATGIARLVVREVDRFPDIGHIWIGNVVEPLLAMMTRLITRQQEIGAIGAGDPRELALSLVGPLVFASLMDDLAPRLGLPGLDLERLAGHHVDVFLHGAGARRTGDDPKK